MVVRAQTSAETVKDTIKKNVDYALPFPGILPDNFLYGAKVMRDKVFEFLIIDPLKKADFYLLQADKRLSAGDNLISSGKSVLGEQTISKAEKYLALSLRFLQTAREKGKDTGDLEDRLKRASTKHEEIINLLGKKSPDSIKSGLLVSEKIAHDIGLKIDDLINLRNTNPPPKTP